MQNLKKYSIIAILTLTVVAGIFNNVPSYAQQSNQTTAATTPMSNQTQTAATEETEEQHATTEASGQASEEEEYSKTGSVRDSVTVLLQDMIIPATDFIHLYDSTPYHIMNGHIALKAPCEDDSTTPIQVLIGSAPNMTAATLENIAPLSTPGEQCLYHVDLVPSGNATILTDVAIKNTSGDDIDFPPTSTIVIGINEVVKGEHGEHAESTEHAATNTAEAGHTE